MSRLGALLMSAALAPAAFGEDKSTPPGWTADTRAATVGANRFAADLYAQLRGQPGSRFVSPYSVHAAFALLSGGAKGATRDEIVKVLHLPADPAKALAVGDLGKLYSAGGKGYELSVANALWGQKGYPWDADFVSRAKDRFGASLQPADFAGDPEGGRAAVNKWVEEQTKDRIKDLLPDGSVTALTRLVLANAVYFKGEWADQFKPAATQTQPFTKADGSKSPVPLMTRTGKYRHAKLDVFQVLELPYAGGDLAMDVFLPADPAGLPAVEAKLSDMSAWLGKLTDEPRVQVYLPKFKVEDRVTLPAVLQAMGMKRVFDAEAADLTGLVSQTPKDNLYVTDAFHKAFVEVSEQGTEAAAATGAVVGLRSIAKPAPDPVVFRADHPFVFVIRDVKNGTVLFVGRYAGPG